jgi:hypothetical protein
MSLKVVLKKQSLKTGGSSSLYVLEFLQICISNEICVLKKPNFSRGKHVFFAHLENPSPFPQVGLLSSFLNSRSSSKIVSDYLC